MWYLEFQVIVMGSFNFLNMESGLLNGGKVSRGVSSKFMQYHINK